MNSMKYPYVLIAAALDRGLTIITDDDVFTRYGVQIIW